LYHQTGMSQMLRNNCKFNSSSRLYTCEAWRWYWWDRNMLSRINIFLKVVSDGTYFQFNFINTTGCTRTRLLEKTIWRQKPENQCRHLHNRENLKSQIKSRVLFLFLWQQSFNIFIEQWIGYIIGGVGGGIKSIQYTVSSKATYDIATTFNYSSSILI
jgi:hypothetical protein